MQKDESNYAEIMYGQFLEFFVYLQSFESILVSCIYLVLAI